MRPLTFAIFGGAGGAGSASGAGQSQVKSRDALKLRLPFLFWEGNLILFNENLHAECLICRSQIFDEPVEFRSDFGHDFFFNLVKRLST